MITLVISNGPDGRGYNWHSSKPHGEARGKSMSGIGEASVSSILSAAKRYFGVSRFIVDMDGLKANELAQATPPGGNSTDTTP